jgi:hypothetical protein
MHMQMAQMAIFLQSLIILFAFLIYTHCNAMLDLLELTHVGEKGCLGLDA